VSIKFAAWVFSGLIALVCLFQLALALGAPWGAYAMGGAFPGAFPPAMRIAALGQIAVLALAGLIVLARAGLALPRWRRVSRGPAWAVVALLGVGLVLNLITPSDMERRIWAPVAALLFLSGLRVALSR
jgi:hypothetical protein